MAELSKDEIMQRLQKVFRNIFDDESISLRPEMTSADIPEWDSMNQIKIIIACEQEFGIRLKPREINALENINEMVEHLSRALSGSH